MWKAALCVGFAVAAIPFGFLMEPLFLLGDWRWGVVALLCILPGLIGYRREIWRFLFPKRTAPLENGEAVTASASPTVSANGKETATLILRAGDIAQAQALYDAFVTTIPAADRYLVHLVNKAYMLRLDDAGKTEEAVAFYRDILSLDRDSVRDDVDFAVLVSENASRERRTS